MKETGHLDVTVPHSAVKLLVIACVCALVKPNQLQRHVWGVGENGSLESSGESSKRAVNAEQVLSAHA